MMKKTTFPGLALLAALIASVGSAWAKEPVAAPAIGDSGVTLMLMSRKAMSEEIGYLSLDIKTFYNETVVKKFPVTVIPVRDHSLIDAGITSGKVRYIYCELDSCDVALKHGFKPVMRRSDAQKAVVLVRAGSGEMSVDALKGKRIGFVGSPALRAIALSDFGKRGIVDSSLIPYPRATVAEDVLNGTLDALMGPSGEIQAIIGNRPAAYRQLENSRTIANAVLLASSNADPEVSAKLVSLLRSAIPSTGSLVWAGVPRELQENPFSEASSTDITDFGLVSSFLKGFK